MCQAIQHGNGESAVFSESNQVCLEYRDLSSALSKIVAASFLFHSAVSNKLAVMYKHNCDRRGRPDYVKTVAQLLPSHFPLVRESPVGWPDLTSVQNLCREALTMSDDDGAWFILNQNGHVNGKPGTVLDAMLPTIRLNAQDAVKAWKKTADGYPRPLQITDSGYYLEGPPTRTLSPITPETAAVYLPCANPNCTDLAATAHYQFPLHIPGSVQLIQLMYPVLCFENVESCRFHAERLARYLVELYPRANVTLVRGSHDGIMDVFGRLHSADYTICGPGWDTACLFPALSKTRGKFVLIRNETSLQQPQPSTMALYSSASSSSSSSLQLVYEPAPTLSSHSREEIAKFTNQAPRQESDCRFIRGRRGVWEQDLVYANRAQYSKPVRHLWGRADKKHKRQQENGSIPPSEHRESTTYAWRDGRSDHTDAGPVCAMHEVTLESLCSVMRGLQLRRILFVGDSMSMNQALSLFMLLGDQDRPEFDQHRASFRAEYNCPLESSTSSTPLEPFSFVLEVARNNQLLVMTEEEAERHMSTVENDFVVQWEPRLLQNPQRTLVVINFGAHVVDQRGFDSTFDHLLERLERLDRQRQARDIFLFRTNVPGHWGCEEEGSSSGSSSVPHRTYAEYAAKRDRYTDEAARFRWQLFEPFNDYATRRIHAHQQRTSDDNNNNNSTLHLELLDVHPMTVLRQDGHVALDSNVKGVPDCLHYSLPGPVDFWNHLLFSNLRDMMRAEQQ